jgi:hypothetical protein
MKGHVRARGPGAWELKYDIGPDPVTGERRIRYATVRGGKREALRKLTELLSQVQRGDHPSARGRFTVGAGSKAGLQTMPRNGSALRPSNAAARLSGCTWCRRLGLCHWRNSLRYKSRPPIPGL